MVPGSALELSNRSVFTNSTRLAITNWDGKGIPVRCRRCLLPKIKGITQRPSLEVCRLLNMKIMLSRWELYHDYLKTMLTYLEIGISDTFGCAPRCITQILPH